MAQTFLLIKVILYTVYNIPHILYIAHHKGSRSPIFEITYSREIKDFDIIISEKDLVPTET